MLKKSGINWRVDQLLGVAPSQVSSWKVAAVDPEVQP